MARPTPLLTKKILLAPTMPVVVVDGERGFPEVAADALGTMGWTVVPCASLEVAADRLRGMDVAVVLCNFEFGSHTGLELLVASDRLKTAFVMVSGNQSPDAVARCLRAGADDVLFKPVTVWDDVHQVLIAAADKLRARKLNAVESAKLAKLADWNSWKAEYLNRQGNDHLKQILRMFHTQLNQDANFDQLLHMVEELHAGCGERGQVEVSREVIEIMLGALRPVARLSGGVGVAVAVLGDAPRLRSVELVEFLTDVQERYEPVWRRLSEMRGHRWSLWVAPELVRLSGRWLEIDREPMHKALTEAVVNALKHSDSGSVVEMQLGLHEGQLSITLTNLPSSRPALLAGKEIHGLPREHEADAFRLFYRLKDEGIITQYEEDWPIGIGLTLIKTVFEYAGGKVSIHNEMWHLSGRTDPVQKVTLRASLPLFNEARKPQVETEAEVDGLQLF